MLYAITDRGMYADDKAFACQRLVEQAAAWAANGVVCVQLREKDLSAREQVALARSLLRAILEGTRTLAARTRLLIHGRPDIALAAGADGVHLPSGPEALTPDEVRQVFAAAGRSAPPVISVSCHTLQEVAFARQQRVDSILFAPVFEKIVQSGPGLSQRLSGTGLALLQEACIAAGPVSVYALGGVTAENSALCLQAGATGIAAIRLLQKPAGAWKHLA